MTQTESDSVWFAAALAAAYRSTEYDDFLKAKNNTQTSRQSHLSRTPYLYRMEIKCDPANRHHHNRQRL